MRLLAVSRSRDKEMAEKGEPRAAAVLVGVRGGEAVGSRPPRQ